MGLLTLLAFLTARPQTPALPGPSGGPPGGAGPAESPPGLLWAAALLPLHSTTPIYKVTPTYARPQQKTELTRLRSMFLLVPGVHWLVVEDAPAPSALVTSLLAASGLATTHLAVQNPGDMKLQPRSSSRMVQCSAVK